MEVRLTRLEMRMDHVESRLTKVEDKLTEVVKQLGEVDKGLAVLTERVSHLPSKGFIVTAVAVPTGLISGLLLFGDRLMGFFGL